MKYLFSIPMLLICTLFVSCDRIANKSELIEKKEIAYLKGDNSPYSGKVIAEFENGGVSFEGEYFNGLKHGAFNSYYNNSQLQSTETYLNGKKDGEFITYSSNGNKTSQCYFVEGKKSGTESLWDENGNLITETEFSKNAKNGKETSYFSSGNLKSEAVYLNGAYNGLIKEWYESGQKKNETEYSKGVKHGHFVSWYKSGVKEAECTYENGNVKGEINEWFETGKPRLGKLTAESLITNAEFITQTGIIEIILAAGPFINDQNKCAEIMDSQIDLEKGGMIIQNTKESVFDYYGQEKSKYAYEAIPSRKMDSLILKTLSKKGDYSVLEVITGSYQLMEITNIVQDSDSKDAEIEYTVRYIPNPLNQYIRRGELINNQTISLKVAKAHFFTNGWRLINK